MRSAVPSASFVFPGFALAARHSFGGARLPNGRVIFAASAVYRAEPWSRPIRLPSHDGLSVYSRLKPGPENRPPSGCRGVVGTSERSGSAGVLALIGQRWQMSLGLANSKRTFGSLAPPIVRLRWLSSPEDVVPSNGQFMA